MTVAVAHKVFYCFENKELADRAAREWFHGEVRTPIELRVSEEALVHRCDAKLLEALPINGERTLIDIGG